MSELVERHLERLLPVFENLERLKLFTREEIRLSVAKVKSHEYRTQRIAKRKEDLLAYIQKEFASYVPLLQYLLCFSKLIAKRRQATGIHACKDEINKTLNRRIDHLFRVACRRYPSDESIWLSRIDYAKRRGMTVLVGEEYNQMLKLHPKKPHLWIAAAKWQMEENMSTQNARTLLHSAVRFNKKCEKLWIELLKFELLNVEKVLKRTDVFLKRQRANEIGGDDAQSVDLKLPTIVFRHAVKTIEGINSCPAYLVSIYAKSTTFIQMIVRFAVSYWKWFVHFLLQSNWPTKWNNSTFAPLPSQRVRCYWENLLPHRSMNDRFANDEKQIDHVIRRDCCFFKTFGLRIFGEGLMDDSFCADQLHACCQKYTSAIENSQSCESLKANLWAKHFSNSLRISDEMRLLYINFCHDVFRLPSSSSRLREQCYLRLFFAYAMTYANCQCDTGFFVDWANICPNAHCKVIVVQAGLRTFPKAVDLWLLLLKYQSDAQMGENDIDASISKAKQLVPTDVRYLRSPQDVLPIWKKAIGRYSSRCPTKLLEQFKCGIHLQASVSNYVKREYLRFVYKAKGIERARKLYHQKLCVVSPASLQLHYDYVSFEMEQAYSSHIYGHKPPCADYIRKSYEKAVVHHGRNVKLWLDYLLFEATIGNAAQCSQIHHRAVRNLPPELVQEFLEANVLREDTTKQRLKTCR
ncbi:hypothetical protein M514_20740 [Trichuris suis]|uniref:U3 small nucleolar RNA-associated protein 6 n=1 Tax=Trichuris suis TaxID=68888 RepID=A0A085NCC4_9BILA|nr:hypothetical protein M514_20740 [Trichuris suis]